MRITRGRSHARRDPFCEVLLRMKAVGLAQDHSCEFPITQVELGRDRDVGGEGLIVLKESTVTVPDWEMLKAVGDFDPTYLHLDKERQHEPAFRVLVPVGICSSRR